LQPGREIALRKPEDEMKKLTVALFLMSGFLMAQEQAAPPPQAHLSETQRLALRTQSPPVKTHSRKHAYKPTKYTVTENKSTIVATKAFAQ
jgi:hypothetical protein